MRAKCDARGCKTRDYKPDVFKGKTVISFCNGEFLKRLPEIVANGKPASVFWVNCMTWTFPNEVAAHRNGWIDYFLFQTDYQRGWLKPELEKVRPVTELPYVPYYNLEGNSAGLSYAYRKPETYFGVGRISRYDASKFAADTWRIFDKVCSPLPTKTFILGYGDNAHKRCGNAPATLDWQTWNEGGIPSREFYPRVRCLIHKTGGSRENLPRVMLEAWHTGTALVCEDDYGFREHVVDGVTGYRCKSSDEMSYRASELAFDENKRRLMVERGYNYLKATFGDVGRCWQGWKDVLG
jgi:hypothetical protein